jgi:hypothetical protein
MRSTFETLNLRPQKEIVFMKTLLTGFACVALSGLFFAQDTTPPPTRDPAPQGQQAPTATQSSSNPSEANGALRLAPGSVIPVQLTKSIDAKKVKTGDEIRAKVTQDLKANSGEVVLPKDTQVLGRITEAQARTKEQKASQVGMTFDHAVLKNGGDVALPMSIQAIIAPEPSTPANNNTGGYNSGAPVPAPSGGGMPSGNSSGRPTGMGGGTPQATTTGEGPTSAQTTGTNPREPITANTQGVVGDANLKLSTAATPAQGSVISSEKGNVKLESGTLMLLRVNP